SVGLNLLGCPVRADPRYNNFPRALPSAMMVQGRRADDLDEEEIASKVIGLKAISIVVQDNAEITSRILAIVLKGRRVQISSPRVRRLSETVQPQLGDCSNGARIRLGLRKAGNRNSVFLICGLPSQPVVQLPAREHLRLPRRD